jgi:hypothetical protein
MSRSRRFHEKESEMSIEDYAKSLIAEVPGPRHNQPPAGVDDGSMEDEKKKKSPPKPNQPHPEEVQYPDYFKGDGSL